MPPLIGEPSWHQRSSTELILYIMQQKSRPWHKITVYMVITIPWLSCSPKHNIIWVCWVVATHIHRGPKTEFVSGSIAAVQNHTHTHLTALCLGLPGWAGTRKVKPSWILLKQQTASGSGISWAICKSAPPSRQITMPGLGFLQAGHPSCHPTNSVKALKTMLCSAESSDKYYKQVIMVRYR